MSVIVVASLIRASTRSIRRPLKHLAATIEELRPDREIAATLARWFDDRTR